MLADFAATCRFRRDIEVALLAISAESVQIVHESRSGLLIVQAALFLEAGIFAGAVFSTGFFRLRLSSSVRSMI